MALRSDLIEESEASKKRRFLGEGRFALGITIGCAISLLFWLAINFGRANLPIDRLIDLAPTAITLFVALASLLISYHVLSENRLMRQAGTDPIILVHLGKRKDAPMLTTVEISNVGAGAALEVRVEVLSGAPDPKRVLTDLTKLIYPIRAIPQNRSISYNFGAGHQLLGASEGHEPLTPIKLRITYKDVEGSVYQNEQVIDVRELKSQQAHIPNETKAANSLVAIEKHLQSITSGHASVNVITQSKDEHKQEKRLLLEELKSIGKD